MGDWSGDGPVTCENIRLEMKVCDMADAGPAGLPHVDGECTLRTGHGM